MKVALVLLAIVLAACSVKDDSEAPPPDVAAPPANALKTPSGIAHKVLTVGLGTAHPTLQSMVTVHYSGWSADGKMFDSSFRHGGPATFSVGGVIPGWTEALQMMVVGEKRRFWIPGKLAYDSSTDPADPKGTLCFDIELLSMK